MIKQPKTLGVIPARMASSRFPGKPLKKILGIPMLAHCYERALLSKACDHLVIATPDEEIMSWSQNHNIPAILTGHHHQRATERAQETLEILGKKGKLFDFILLLQGDEPQIFPDDIKNLSNALCGSELEIINLVYPIDGDDLGNPNVVKAIMSNASKISFFTRAHVPNRCEKAMRQLGMIGFTIAALTQYTNLQPTPLEELESIDMMRLLENDYEINAVISSSHILGVDNPEDIAKAELMMTKDLLLKTYQDKYL
ncbi:3-deoxy-manno-octulosonate cytidylyltransferase [Gammaproteobacteria bacterium]|jgi:3-deoxy-manno-octulosonate cytidylyltransferase (CMP-KDO synthetase)|nr:3-deoxy-manno-octulosonate cytidylyltransferase [Gammaproteobacteria bacterium]